MKPTRLFVPSPKIAVQLSKGKGRGVFTTVRVRAGEVIEAAPVLLVPKAQQDALVATFLGHYMFQSDNKKHYVIGLGLSSMINHDVDANAEFYVSIDTITIKARRAIPAGTEVTLDYGWNPEEWAVLGIEMPESQLRTGKGLRPAKTP